MIYIVNWWVGMGTLMREGTWEFSHDPTEDELKEYMDEEIANYVDAGYNRE